jgi:hypothetical protein
MASPSAYWRNWVMVDVERRDSKAAREGQTRPIVSRYPPNTREAGRENARQIARALRGIPAQDDFAGTTIEGMTIQ